MARPGFLQLTTGRVDADFLSARNTLTQRAIGSECSGSTALDVTSLKDGDFVGLALLQRHYGLVGVKAEVGTNFVVMVNAQSNTPAEVERVLLSQKTVFLRADCDFRNQVDKARFLYSLDGKTWTPIGNELRMRHTLPHFMGYRYGLFNYATKEPGGHADFDWFRIRHIIPSRKLIAIRKALHTVSKKRPVASVWTAVPVWPLTHRVARGGHHRPLALCPFPPTGLPPPGGKFLRGASRVSPRVKWAATLQAGPDRHTDAPL